MSEEQTVPVRVTSYPHFDPLAEVHVPIRTVTVGSLQAKLRDEHGILVKRMYVQPPHPFPLAELQLDEVVGVDGRAMVGMGFGPDTLLSEVGVFGEEFDIKDVTTHSIVIAEGAVLAEKCDTDADGFVTIDCRNEGRHGTVMRALIASNNKVERLEGEVASLKAQLGSVLTALNGLQQTMITQTKTITDQSVAQDKALRSFIGNLLNSHTTQLQEVNRSLDSVSKRSLEDSAKHAKSLSEMRERSESSQSEHKKAIDSISQRINGVAQSVDTLKQTSTTNRSVPASQTSTQGQSNSSNSSTVNSSTVNSSVNRPSTYACGRCPSTMTFQPIGSRICNKCSRKCKATLRCGKCDFDLCSSCALSKEGVAAVCDKSHILASKPLASAVRCDKCSGMIPAGEITLQCASCNFDMCPTCAIAKGINRQANNQASTPKAGDKMRHCGRCSNPAMLHSTSPLVRQCDGCGVETKETLRCGQCSYDRCPSCALKVEGRQTKCNAGHTSQPRLVQINGCVCDKCNERIAPGILSMRCHPCDYDECPSCVFKGIQRSGSSQKCDNQ